MLKIISITLTEKMIRQIDEALINGDFSSRSDFFRVLIRTWFLKPDHESRSDHSALSSVSEQNDQMKVDLEYGVPDELIRKFEEKAKLKN